MATRTVIKANFVRASANGQQAMRQAATASARYYSERNDRDGERQERQAFTSERDGLSLAEVRESVASRDETLAYRMVLSPGVQMGDDELRDWARTVMLEVGETLDRDTGYVAYIHSDQTEHPHVHAIAFANDHLDRGDFATLREVGDQALERIVERERGLEIDPMAQTYARAERQDLDAGLDITD
jgi:hypothetical protein